MEWVKLVAAPAYYLDGALLRAGEAAEVLFCRGLAHCGAVESGGLIDKAVLPILIGRPGPRAAALVREGLWLDEGTHYRIRSWDKWQDEHDAAAERRRKDRDRKRTLRGQVQGRSADRRRDVSTVSAECPGGDVDVEREKELTPQAPSVLAPPAATTPKPASRGTRVPESFPLTEPLLAWGREHAPAVEGRAETENWLDWHRAKGDTAKDWTASWRTWMRRAQHDAESRGYRAPLAIVGPGRQRPSTSDAAAQAALDAGARVAARRAAQEPA